MLMALEPEQKRECAKEKRIRQKEGSKSLMGDERKEVCSVDFKPSPNSDCL